MQRSQLITIAALMLCFGVGYAGWRARQRDVFQHEGPGRAAQATAIQVYREGVPVRIPDQAVLADVVALIAPTASGWERQLTPMEGVFRFSLLRDGDVSVPFELGEDFIVSGGYWRRTSRADITTLRTLLVRAAMVHAPPLKAPGVATEVVNPSK